MAAGNRRPKGAEELRRRAEELCRAREAGPLDHLEDVSPEAMRLALHRLRVHQTELEMQNEELRRTQTALDAERERYFELYDLAPVGYCTLNEKGLIQQANLTAASLLGFVRGVLIGQPFRRFILRDDQDIYHQHWKKLFAAGEPLAAELRMVKQEGLAFWVRLEATVVKDDDDDGPVCRVMLLDITERKRDEELRDQIERVMRHDLRTPACNAVNIARMFREEADLTGEQRHNLLNLFEQSGLNMLETLNSSLDIYKIETGKYQLQPEAFDCLALVLEISEVLAETARGAGIRQEVLLGGQAPGPDSRCPCLGRPELLRTVLQNLLNNAVEASPPGAAVVVELSSGADCRIEIRNTGVVPVEIRERFFDKYVTKGKASGTGIGTYSARLMVNAQGGDLSMRTSDGDNETVLTLRLPC